MAILIAIGTNVSAMDSARPPGESGSSERVMELTENTDVGKKVESSDWERIVQKVEQSWVSIVEDKKRLKKHDV